MLGDMMANLQLPKKIRAIHVGDKVKIINPVIVDRVGYPKTLKDYKNESDKQAVINLLGCSRGYQEDNLPKEIKIILSEIAHYRARSNGFGGRSRSLHCTERPELKDTWVSVSEMKTVVTGDYYPPHKYDNYEYGGYEYENGGLDNVKYHRLAGFYTNGNKCFFREQLIWISTDNVLRQDQIWELDKQKFKKIVSNHASFNAG